MSDLREVHNAVRTQAFDCEICGDTYTSMRAAWLCEERDIAEAKEARRPVRHIMRPGRDNWDED